MKLNHVVISTDLSEASCQALQPAVDLARTSGAKLTLLYVLEEVYIAPHGAPLAPPVTPITSDERQKAAQKALEGWRAKLGVQAQLEVLPADDIAQAISRYTLEKKADLLCVATHGRTGFRHLVLGSVAESIIRHSKVPVMIFPQPRK
jgi:nucleotide-binding universal stress UspA family protein